jgi:prepilin-type N-terminal cleavage/methylation domain-containing protein
MNKKGFTLIELIIVIAIIALLAAATFVAVDPAKRIGEARDAQRWSDVTAVADAYMKYLVDNNGVAASTTIINGTDYFIQHTAGAAVTSAPASCPASTTVTTGSPVDLHALVTNGYIGDIPDDPAGTDNDGTDYYFYADAQGKIIVGACTKYSGATNYPNVVR